MAQALLIAGAAPRQMVQAKNISKFLKHNIGNVSLVETAYLTTDQLQFKMKTFLKSHPSEPTLIYYSGHGNQGLWSLNEDYSLDYVWLAKLLKQYQDKFPILIINDCCAAGSIIESLETVGIDSTKVGLIAATHSYNYAYSGNLLYTLLSEWGKQKAHVSQRLNNETSKEVLDVIDYITIMECLSTDTPYRRCLKYARHLVRFLVKTRNCLFNRIIIRLSKWQGVTRLPSLSDDQVTQRWGAELDHYFFQKGAPPIQMKYVGKKFLTVE